MSATEPAAGPSATAQRRHRRQRQLIEATRELFDSRGVRDIQVDDVVTAVGINRSILYRHFTSKEELFALTLVEYLDELRALLTDAVRDPVDPRERLTDLVGAFVEYGTAHPAFVDCAQSLIMRPGEELLDAIAHGPRLELGRAVSGCLAVLVGTLEYGVDRGDFTVPDPVLLANLLYATGLGALQLGRVGILVGEDRPGVPTMAPVSHEQVRAHLVATALAAATGPSR